MQQLEPQTYGLSVFGIVGSKGANGVIKLLNRSDALEKVIFNSKQLGQKWGKHKFDYTDLKSHNEYKNLAEEVFNNPEKIIHDSSNGEYYYTRGQDLLRLKENGDFVSLYPGSSNEKVTKAIENGGLIWEQ